MHRSGRVIDGECRAGPGGAMAPALANMRTGSSSGRWSGCGSARTLTAGRSPAQKGDRRPVVVRASQQGAAGTVGGGVTSSREAVRAGTADTRT